MDVGGSPTGIAAGSNSELVFVANRDSNTLTELQFEGMGTGWIVTETFDVGDSPIAVAIHPALGLGARAAHGRRRELEQLMCAGITRSC